MEGLLAVLPFIIVPLVIIIAIIVVITVIKRKIRNFTKDALGMTPSEAMNMISEGLKNETTLPKPITSLSEVYAPKIKRDFPQVGYEGMKQMAENGLSDVLNAIESKDISVLNDTISNSLTNKVDGIINDLNSKGLTQKYYNKKIHKSGISSYVKKGETYSAIFEIAIQYDYSLIDRDGKTKESQSPMQAAYRITLTYDQKLHEKTTNLVYSSTCPNCGAPINAADGKCHYCGSGFTEIAERLWLVSDFNLFK